MLYNKRNAQIFMFPFCGTPELFLTFKSEVLLQCVLSFPFWLLCVLLMFARDLLGDFFIFFFQISSFFYFPLSVFIRKCLICNLLSGEFLISHIKRAFCPLMRCLATICLEFRAENLLSPGAQTLALSKGVLHKWMVIKV